MQIGIGTNENSYEAWFNIFEFRRTSYQSYQQLIAVSPATPLIDKITISTCSV